jgi:sugar (pentulose or hexulose) kinase
MNVAVLDVGKTNVKAALVDLEAGREIDVRIRPNAVLTDGPYPHFDVDAIFDFFLVSLGGFHAAFGFDAISVATHGASGALLGDEGLALPVMDYEFRYPAAIDEAYGALRPPFSETFSPRLPGGLNLGAQLHYQKTRFPQRFRSAKTVVTYPQYWGWRLTGAAATDPTSLGCHTDLWRPKQGVFSDLAAALEIDDRLAPVRRPSDVLGPLRDDLATRLGLLRSVPVHCGIHDSNASLLPHLVERQAPFSVVSTGTWVVTFSVGGDLEHLDPDRDTLANVDAFGRAVPSARFMGGREFEILTAGRGAATPEAVRRVVEGRILFTPSVVPRSGPFPRAKHRTLNASAPLNDDEKHVSASLYAALMTATCVALTGGAGPILLEGPFARNPLYVEALSKASGRAVIGCSGATGTSLGAAMLGRMSSTFAALPAAPPGTDQLPAAFADYRAEWLSAASRQAGSC